MAEALSSMTTDATKDGDIIVDIEDFAAVEFEPMPAGELDSVMAAVGHDGWEPRAAGLRQAMVIALGILGLTKEQVIEGFGRDDETSEYTYEFLQEKLGVVEAMVTTLTTAKIRLFSAICAAHLQSEQAAEADATSGLSQDSR